MVKEVLLLNYSILDTLFLSSYPPLYLCGNVLLAPPPEEPTGSLHTIHAGTKFIYWPPCDILRNFFLPPPNILPYWPKPFNFQCRVCQGPLPFTTVAPPCRHTHNPSCNPVMGSLQDHRHRIHEHQASNYINNHRLYYRIIYHLPCLDRCPSIPQHLCYHTPYPLSLPKVATQCHPVAIILYDRPSKVG